LLLVVQRLDHQEHFPGGMAVAWKESWSGPEGEAGGKGRKDGRRMGGGWLRDGEKERR